ncbi:hypothetical protein COOONC_08305 [Cooperia oncophora]
MPSPSKCESMHTGIVSTGLFELRAVNDFPTGAVDGPLPGGELRSNLAQGLVPNAAGGNCPSGMNIYNLAIRTFWREVKLIGIDPGMMFTESLLQDFEAPLRFTQMAWASTYQVGCGVRLCGGTTAVVVCRYNPRGNIVNQNIYNVGTTCSQCRNCTTSYPGLCFPPT